MRMRKLLSISWRFSTFWQRQWLKENYLSTYAIYEPRYTFWL